MTIDRADVGRGLPGGRPVPNGAPPNSSGTIRIATRPPARPAPPWAPGRPARRGDRVTAEGQELQQEAEPTRRSPRRSRRRRRRSPDEDSRGHDERRHQEAAGDRAGQHRRHARSLPRRRTATAIIATATTVISTSCRGPGSRRGSRRRRPCRARPRPGPPAARPSRRGGIGRENAAHTTSVVTTPDRQAMALSRILRRAARNCASDELAREQREHPDEQQAKILDEHRDQCDVGRIQERVSRSQGEADTGEGQRDRQGAAARRCNRRQGTHDQGHDQGASLAGSSPTR